MKKLPKGYTWLAQEPGPKMLLEALKLYGTVEAPGKKDNPVIIAWAKEVGGTVEEMYKADSIPWCGLAMAIVALRANKEIPLNPLWALNWSNFGVKVDEPMLGDTLTFIRTTKEGKRAGHVGLYVGEDKSHYHVFGGNQADMFGFIRIAKSRLYVAVRPKYNNQPPNVRKVLLSNLGKISTNEQ